jgi:hypothetical protein
MAKKYRQFIWGISAIMIFIFGVVPVLTNNQKSVEMRQFIEENDIDANALFYTESEKAGEAEFYFMKKSLSDSVRILED